MFIGNRRALLGDSVPGWVRSRWGALTPYIDWAFDFTNHRYWLRGVGQVPLAVILSLSGAGSEMAVNSAGVYSSFASGTPALTDLGFQILEARTNSVLYNQQIDNAVWNKTDITVTADAGVAPDGTVSADLVAEGSAGNAQLFQSLIPITASVPNTLSVFIKRSANVQWIRGLSGSTNRPQVWFDIQNGVVGTIGTNTGSPTNVSASISPASNGWFRISITATCGTDTTNILSLTSASANGSTSRLSGSAYYLWGAQSEIASFATSPIITAGATAARGARIPTLIGPAAAMMTNAKSMFFKTFGIAGTTTNNRLFFFNGVARLSWTSSTALSLADSASHASGASLPSGTYAGLSKIAAGFDASGSSLRVNGSALGTNANAWTGNTGALNIGSDASGTTSLNGFMQEFAGSMRVKGHFDGVTA